MRKLLVLAALSLAVPALAQKQPDPQKAAQRRADALEKRLDLKPDQKKKIQKILEEDLPQVMELQKKARKAARAMQDKIRAELDDDQKKKYDQARKRGPRRGQQGKVIGGESIQGGMQMPDAADIPPVQMSPK